MTINTQQLVIINPTNVDTCNNLIKQKSWQWSFMGTDPCLREKIISQLGSENRYCYAEEFQNTCIEQKKPFLDWMANIGKQQDKTLWWATSIAYKSPYASDFFLNYCYLTLIQEWIEQKVKNRVIIIENPWLLKACLNNFDVESVNIIVSTNYFITKWIKHNVCSYGRLLFFLLRSLKMWIVNKIYSLKYHKQITNILKSKIDVLTCTWIENRSFKGKNNKFSDPYLGTLNDYYKKLGLKVATITLPLFPIKLLKKAYSCGEIIPSIYFTRLSDILRSFFKALFLKYDKKIPDKNEFDLTSIVEYEMISEKGGICYTFLHYLSCLNLVKRVDMSCLALIYPFEYQPWDKIMVRAVKHANSKCRVVGYQHGTVSPFNLNYFLGKGEGKIAPQPDMIVSNGEHWKKVLEKSGFVASIKNGGSLRFNPKGESTQTETLPISEERKKKVLVILSTSLMYSLDVIYYLLRCSTHDREFLLKPHPDLPVQLIRKYIKRFPDNFRFIDGSMDKWMEQVGWAIHIGSTAAIECMMQGITVFKYLPERVDLDPLLGMDFKQKVLTDKDNLNFQDKVDFDLPDKALIAEPFNKEMWNSILEQKCL